MITVATLVYKDTSWIDFLLDSLHSVKSNISFKTLVVANDANEQVIKSGKWDIDFRNADPNEYYINRVYKAWNRAVEAADTELVVLINSDMYVSDYWLDTLYATKTKTPKSLPCSLLVESGRMRSALPEFVRNFGLTPKEFKRREWLEHANAVRDSSRTSEGKLFMPVLLSKTEFMKVGGYPHGNINGVSGDKILFDKYKQAGFSHITVHGSIVYHVQEGEMRA